MSTKHLNMAFSAKINKSSLKFILVALADYANEHGEAYPSTETMTNKTALNRKTILSGLKELEQLGFISETGERKGQTGQIRVWKLELNQPEIGTVKPTQKRNHPKNGTIPKTDSKKPENGTLKASQKRDIEPSVSLTISEPPESSPRKRFVKPTFDDVRNYCTERQNSINPIKFFNYYESNGWKVGKSPMKDWKAAIRNWEQREKDNATHKQARNDKQSNYLDELANLG